MNRRSFIAGALALAAGAAAFGRRAVALVALVAPRWPFSVAISKNAIGQETFTVVDQAGRVVTGKTLPFGARGCFFSYDPAGEGLVVETVEDLAPEDVESGDQGGQETDSGRASVEAAR